MLDRNVFVQLVDLFTLNEGIACFFPGFDTTGKAFYVLVSHSYISGCLTGSACFLGSGSVENNLLTLFKRRKLGFEFIE
jgi:hypothetical protein